jgi:hypothetical protein
VTLICGEACALWRRETLQLNGDNLYRVTEDCLAAFNATLETDDAA